MTQKKERKKGKMYIYLLNSRANDVSGIKGKGERCSKVELTKGKGR